VRDRATGKDRTIGRLEGLENFAPVGGLQVSPDAATILYTRRVGSGSDLMRIENFR
jgi:hypothetical protein